MHDRPLHTALAALADDAARLLSDALCAGAEVPFELVDEGKRGAPLYCYRPRTDRFIGDRLADLDRLPHYAAAISSLERQPGLEAYLRRCGHAPGSEGIGSLEEPRERAEAVLHAFLLQLFDGATDFGAVDRARFKQSYLDLESILFGGRTLTRVVVELEGLVLESSEVHLAGGLSLVRAETVTELPEEIDPTIVDVVALHRDQRGSDEGSALEDAASALRQLQSALRLWDPAAPALAPVAYLQTDGGAWLPVALAVGVRRSAGAIVLGHDDEDPFRAFCSLVGRRAPRGGTLAWALRRFELGVERASALEALSDFLLAGRSLLEPEGPQSELLGERLAAICAPAGAERDGLADRIDAAAALERSVMHGSARAEPDVVVLVDELGDCLRAVLRDVLCGHLDPDVRSLADRLVSEAEPEEEPEPVAVEDTDELELLAEPEPEPEPAAEPEEWPEREPEPAAEVDDWRQREPEPAAEPGAWHEIEAEPEPEPVGTWDEAMPRIEPRAEVDTGRAAAWRAAGVQPMPGTAAWTSIE